MTMNEFKEAMKTEEMQKEFAAFHDGKKAETKEAAAKALAAFAAAKGVAAEGVQALNDDALEATAGGIGFLEFWNETWESLKEIMKPER